MDATRQSHYDLVISGAGIAGLVAGIRARQLGLTALILEKQDHFTESLKGEYIQPAGIRTLQKMGIADKLADQGLKVSEATYHFWPFPFLKQTRSIKLSYPSLKSRYPAYALALPHLELKKTLSKVFCELGGELWMGTSISHFNQNQISISTNIAKSFGVTIAVRRGELTQIVTATHIAISEGLFSSLAHKLGRPWLGEERPTSFMIGGVTTGDTVPVGDFVTAQSQEGLILCFKISPQSTRVYFFKDVTKSLPNPFKERRPIEYLKRAIESSVIADQFKFAHIDERVMAAPYISRYTEEPSLDAITLIGDAGGASHPLGGYGMSTAATDGFTIAELLKKMKVGKISQARLNQSYNQSRMKRYLTSKFVGDILTVVLGGQSLAEKTFRRVVLEIWARDPKARQECSRILGGMLNGPLSIKEFLKPWGIHTKIPQILEFKDISKIYYGVRSWSPGRYFLDRTR